MEPDTREQLTTSSDLKELGSIREFVRRFCERIDSPLLGDEVIGLIELGVNESASNIMRHAYGGRADGEIRIEARGYGDRVCFILCDTGEAFDPEDVSPPVLDGTAEGGLGIFIIRQIFDEVTYSREAHGKNLTSLTKCF
jgi:anti-sigma regulatory factor (Ser/Thr protein kinase)